MDEAARLARQSGFYVSDPHLTPSRARDSRSCVLVRIQIRGVVKLGFSTMRITMATQTLVSPAYVQVSCITKHGDHYDPHERIQGLGGIQAGQRWWLSENDIIAELRRPIGAQRWNFYVSVDGKSVWVIIAVHDGRAYLKTEADGYAPNNLLNLPECS
jgi:hypothetical protein